MNMHSVTKRRISKLLFLTTIVNVHISLIAQTKDHRNETETIAFMNYIRDSVLKIDTWATRLYFQKIEATNMFGEPNYARVWKLKTDNVFTDKEIAYIGRHILDTSTYMLTDKMLRYAYAKPETVSYDFYKLADVLKFFIEYYNSGTFKIAENSIDTIHIDSSVYRAIVNTYPPKKEIHTKLDSMGNLFGKAIADKVTKDVNEYNQTAIKIQNYIQSMIKSYRYQFARPIFIRHYTYCVLIYSYGNDTFNGSGTIQIFKKQHEKWTLYKTLVKRFSTGHDVY
ncbi:hypothetical protein A9P82_08165 [Arachidicoccus ginsenosidimutans]|uniref:hypothetical protein n=1 Tax=Arachidicoccus sp. BS20 TaxID=1850526 RepID=UPI0007F164D4|nr:hypothetical protein [Arachidicoccus sp. BS20]ANI89267.1 hypothetical protein A9P82_08165 [Arachidicoccus sp. BS20]